MSGSTRQVWAVARKELRGYFGSPLALIFLGVFLALSLFIFFWVESFFARNIADLRPLFRWMPILMIFLIRKLHAGVIGQLIAAERPSVTAIVGLAL